MKKKSDIINTPNYENQFQYIIEIVAQISKTGALNDCLIKISEKNLDKRML
jgi:hypothetical protein